MKEVECPLCRQNDAIKVSSIVSLGELPENLKGSSAATAGFLGQRTREINLPRLLSPPRKPNTGIDATGLLYILCIVAMVLLGAVSVHSLVYNFSPGHALKIFWAFLVIFGTQGAIGLIGFREKRGQKLQEDLEVWRARMKKWQQLNYCYRDDIVFAPTSDLYVKPGDMHRLISLLVRH